MRLPSRRSWMYLVSFVSFVIFLTSLYFQYIRGLQPCPLCIMQRFCALLLALIGLSASLVNTAKNEQRLVVAIIIMAGFGSYFSIRQLWLQSLPADLLPACLPGLDIMLHYLPLKDILHALFWGASDCSEVSWRWLGFSMAAWSLLYFLFVGLGSLVSYFLFGSRESKS